VRELGSVRGTREADIRRNPPARFDRRRTVCESDDDASTVDLSDGVGRCEGALENLRQVERLDDRPAERRVGVPPVENGTQPLVEPRESLVDVDQRLREGRIAPPAQGKPQGEDAQNANSRKSRKYYRS
jgi:hypothetical protein